MPVAWVTDGISIYLEDLTSTANPNEGEDSTFWTEVADAAIQSSPTVTADAVYYGDDKSVVVRGRDDGEEFDRFSIGATINQPIIVLENVVIVTANGRIVAIAGE